MDLKSDLVLNSLFLQGGDQHSTSIGFFPFA